MLDVDDLPSELTDEAAGETTASPAVACDDQLVGKPFSEIEKHYIVETLKLCGGNREEAAMLLGIGERTLYRKIKEYQL